jgi:hypothetical protein
MSRTDHRTLIDRGRKAGLSTSELYVALATRRSEEVESFGGSADGNGFVSGYGPNGQLIYRPVGSRTVS